MCHSITSFHRTDKIKAYKNLDNEKKKILLTYSKTICENNNNSVIQLIGAVQKKEAYAANHFHESTKILLERRKG